MSSLESCNLGPGLVRRPSNLYHWADYLVFTLTLIVSAIVGLYYGIKTRSRMSVREMLLGGKEMNLYSVAFSLVATVTSTIFVLGVPSRTYYSKQWPLYVAFSFIPATIITVHVFIPIFHKLGVTSAYEYLGIRFNGIVRFMTALDFIAMMNLTQALTIYSPAVSFSLVAGVPLEVSILAAGLVCTFYTALGGLRAVVVTDIFQISTVLIGILGLFIKGAIDAGGISNVFKQITTSNRLVLWSIEWTNDGTYTLMSQVLGGTVIFLGLLAANQTTVQRYCSVNKCRDAQKAAYIALVFYIVMWVLVLMVGLVIYSFYYTCDPMVLQIISSPDEILPLFVMDTLGHLHGLPGLFSAAVFGAVLSSVSSGINSLSAVTLEDIIKPLYHRRKKKELPEYYCRSLTRTLALFYGMLSIGLSYVPVKYGSYILNLDMTFSAYGVLGGPIIGVFVLGIVFPVANSLGGGIGLVIGTLFGIWMWIGRLLCENSGHEKVQFPQPTECSSICNLTGFSMTNSKFKGFPAEKIFVDCPLQAMYDVSYLWYGLIGSFITIAIGLFVSMVSGAHGAKRVSPDLLCWPRLKASLEKLCHKRTAGGIIAPTIESTSHEHPSSEVSTALPTEKNVPTITPSNDRVLILKPDGESKAETTQNPAYQPPQPVPCYLEKSTLHPENADGIIYQGDGILHSVSSRTLAFDRIQTGYQGGGEQINEGYASEAIDDNGIRVLYQPDEDNVIVGGDSMVLSPDALPPAEGIRYRPGTHPNEIPLHSAVYPGEASTLDTEDMVLYDGAYQYENPIFHNADSEGANSQIGQPYSDTTKVPTLWS